MTPRLLVAFLGLLTAVQGSQYWRPKLLGSFYLKDAAFVEAFENPLSEQGDLDKFTLYFTTFNFGERDSRGCSAAYHSTHCATVSPFDHIFSHSFDLRSKQ